MAWLRVRDRIFAALPPDETWVAVRVAQGENVALAAERPAVFSVPHHYRNSPVVVVSLAAVDRQEPAELLNDAWRLRAPTGLRASADGAAPGRRLGSDPG